MNPKSMILNLRKKGAHRSSLPLHPVQNAHNLPGRVGASDCQNLLWRGMGFGQIACYYRA